MSVSADPPPETTPTTDQSRDHFLKIPLIVAAAGPVGIVCLLAGPLDIMVFAAIPLVIIWLSAVLAMLILAFRCGRARKWKEMSSALASPMVLLIAVADFPDYMRASARSSEYLHFGLLSPYYIAKVDSLPHDGARFTRFDWGGLVFASQALVYDETDEIQLPPGTQSQAWLGKTKNSEFACQPWGHRHLVDHFYIAYFFC